MSEVKIIASKESPSKYDMWIHYINKKIVLQRYVNGKWATIASEDLSLIDPTDFTQEYQDKLDSIAAGAEVNTINKVLIDSTELPIENKQVVIPWDTKEDKIVRFSMVLSSGHYAVLNDIKINEPLLISVTTVKYGNISKYGFIFHTGESSPKATGNISAKFGNSRNSIGVAMDASHGIENIIVSVLPLSDNKFTGTLTDESTYAGSEITNSDSVYEHVNNKTKTLNTNSTDIEYPSAKAVYNFTKVKSKNFTGSGGGTDIKFAFIPFNANALFSFQRESGAFGEGLMYIRTNNTTVERVVCDSSFRTYDTYFYETSGGVVLCYNVDAEPYNITISTIYDSSGECILGTTKSLSTQIDVDLVKMQELLTAGANITITDGEIDTKRVVELTDITIANGASAIKIITTDGGKQAVAEGLSTIASGDYSHAEGGSTQATGIQSHAEGAGTTASGGNSHAEGGGTTASGPQSHAEGGGTTAEGQNSHAEGSGTTASGNGSHAEGGGTTASGSTSHAEGGSTTASGECSHAEGGSTTASGYKSHAEGTGTTAKHRSQHAFGEYNGVDPSTASSDARGNYIEIVGNGADENTRSNARTLDWSGNEVLAGTLTVGGDVTANGINLNSAISELQQSQSDWNQSDSESSEFVKNRPFYEDIVDELVLPDPPANGVMYFDWGEIVPVVGKSYSIEFDTDNDGNGILEHQIVIGIGEANTEYSPNGVRIASNQGQLAYNPNSFSSEGHNVNGKFNGNPNVRNIRLVDSVLQKIDAKFIDGYMTAGTGVNSNKFNNVATNVASGNYSHAEGQETTAIGTCSHAEGSGTKAIGIDSHAQGYNTTASGDYSHAEGDSTTASGYASHAECNSTTASGDNSHAEGIGTTASGDYSHAEGNHTIARGPNSHAGGKYNIEDITGGKLFIVGNGTSAARHNAFSVNDDNSITIGDTTITEAQLIALLATLNP